MRWAGFTLRYRHSRCIKKPRTISRLDQRGSSSSAGFCGAIGLEFRAYIEYMYGKVGLAGWQEWHIYTFVLEAKLLFVEHVGAVQLSI